MNTNTFSKDNSAATFLLASLFTLIIVAAFSSAPATATESKVTATSKVETIVVTATRLK